MSTPLTIKTGAGCVEQQAPRAQDRSDLKWWLVSSLSRFLASRWGKHVLALLLFAVVHVGMMYPVTMRPGFWVWGRPFEDAFESIWYLEWYARALLSFRVSPLFNPGIFYPGGWDLRFTTLPPLYPLIFAPITAALGSVRTYNLMLLGSCVFAAYGGFVLASHISGSWWGACIAGVLFAYAPQREIYFGGHLNFLLGSMWLPWIVYGLLRSITASRHRSRWALFSGLATGLSVAGAWQFIFMSAGLVSLFLLGALRAWSDRVKAMLRDYRFVGIFALSTLAVVLPLALLMLPARRLAVDAPWSFTGADMTSVHLERVLSPSWQNPLWRNFSRAWWPLENGQDGVVGFSLAGAALVLFTLSRRRLTKAAPWVCLALGGTALMLGLTLHLGGKTVLIPVPDRLAGRIAGLWPVLVGESYPAGWAGRVPVLLPSGFLFILFSPYRNFHHYGRWALVSALGLAVLTAKAFSAGVRGQLAWKRAGVGLLLLSAVLLEYNLQPPANVTSVADMRRQVDDWLAVQPELGVLLEVPLSYTFGGHTLYNALFHNQKIVHGYSSIPPRAFQEMRPILDQWPSDETIDLLTRLGVDYVLVNVFAGNEATFEGAELPAILSRPQLRLVGRFPDAVGPVRAIYPFQLAR